MKELGQADSWDLSMSLQRGARLPAHITKALVFQVRSDRATSSLLTAMISIYPIRKENI